jgi:hypothetical protein
LASVRMIGETAPNSIQRISSSGVSRRPRAKKPPMSEPQREIHEVPMLSACLTADARPSKPKPTVGSPPQTICA